MTIEQFVRLAARLFAVWLVLLQGIHMAVIVFTPDSSPEMGRVQNGYAIGLVLIALLCAFLWFFPLSLAKGIVAKEDMSKKLTTSFTLEDIQALCFSLMGLWCAINALYFFFQVPDSILDLFLASPESSAYEMAWQMGVPHLLQFFLSIWLFVGGRGLGGFVNWLRNMPRKSPLE